MELLPHMRQFGDTLAVRPALKVDELDAALDVEILGTGDALGGHLLPVRHLLLLLLQLLLVVLHVTVQVVHLGHGEVKPRHIGMRDVKG